jgi:RNA polymerase sigma factor (sigma-70 family)
MTHEQRVAAFDRLRVRYLRFLTAVLWRLTGDRELFAEAMQYALLGLWQHADKLTERPAGYVYRIALSANSKAWRQRVGRNGDITCVPIGDDESPDEKTRRADLVAQVRRAISRLPEKQSKAIVMRYFEQKDYSAIADYLDCSEATARSHVSKAVATLKRKLAIEQERDHDRARL